MVSLSDIRCYLGDMTTATVHLTDQVAANVRQLMGRDRIPQRTICQCAPTTAGYAAWSHDGPTVETLPVAS